MIDSIFDDRDLALIEGRNMLNGRHATGVRVIEERFNEETGQTATKIIFQGRKGEDRAPPHVPQERSAGPRIAVAQPPPSQPSFVKSAVTLVLVVGGIGLAALLGLVFLLDYAG